MGVADERGYTRDSCTKAATCGDGRRCAEERSGLHETPTRYHVVGYLLEEGGWGEVP